VFFETLGACWALSARNVSGMFPIQLQLDLSKLELLYGIPSMQLEPETIDTLIALFQVRPKQTSLKPSTRLESNAHGLLNEMNNSDFLSFTMGFQDAVNQVLEQLDPWDHHCQQSYLALKFFSITLIEHGVSNPHHRSIYADLLVEYILTTQYTFALEKKTSSFNY
jgi:hypothetical protein